MEDYEERTSFIFEIDNFSEKKASLSSPIFTSGRCSWCVKLFPKRYNNRDYVLMYLDVADARSLRLEWKRKADYSFIILNESGKELNRVSDNHLFSMEVLPWFYHKLFEEEECVVNNKLIIKVELKVTEVVHYGDETSMEMLDFNGFQILRSQFRSVKKIFEKHPKVAVGIKPKSQLVKTAYMNVLLGLIETLKKHPLSLSLTDISNADSDLTELTKAGFKVDWLKSKLNRLFLSMKNLELTELDFKLESTMKKKTLDDVYENRIKKIEERINNFELMNTLSNACDVSTVQQLNERVKNLELKKTDFKLDCLKSKLAEACVERKALDDACGSRVQQLEERVKSIELKELDLKLGILKSKLVKVWLEMKASEDASESRVEELEGRVMSIELKETDLKLDCLESKLAVLTLEKKTSDDANRSRVQEFEERFKNLELIIGNLKVELDKKKTKSCDDGFLLVN